MKNIAIINTCDFGSTGKIATGLFRHLESKGYHCLFAYGRGEKKNTDDIVRIEGKISVASHYAITRILGADGYGSVIATKRLIRRLKKAKTDTVYIVSLHGHYLNENMLFRYLSAENIKVIYIMIDEYAYLGGCDYAGECSEYKNQCMNCRICKANPISKAFRASHRRYLSKYDYYRKLKNPVFVGPEYTIVSAAKTGLLDGLDKRILDEAINTDLYKPRDTKAFREALCIPEDKIVIVCVAPYSYGRKGVRYFYELADQMRNNDQYLFVHIGYDGEEEKHIPNMIIRGYEKDQEKLSLYYAMGDLFVFPSLQDTMPNACLEALASGSPLLCFDISGMPYIANDEVASFVEAGNVAEMKRVVLATGKKTAETIEKCRNYALSRYDSRKYFEALEKFGL